MQRQAAGRGGFYIVVMRGDIIGQYGWFVTSCGFERGKWDEGDIAAWRPFPALPCEYHELWGDTNDDADGWIPCDEQLPENADTVWVCTKSGEVDEDSFRRDECGKAAFEIIGDERYNYISNGWYDRSCDRFDPPVCWMPIIAPKPPKGMTKETEEEA